MHTRTDTIKAGERHWPASWTWCSKDYIMLSLKKGQKLSVDYLVAAAELRLLAAGKFRVHSLGKAENLGKMSPSSSSTLIFSCSTRVFTISGVKEIASDQTSLDIRPPSLHSSKHFFINLSRSSLGGQRWSHAFKKYKYVNAFGLMDTLDSSCNFRKMPSAVWKHSFRCSTVPKLECAAARITLQQCKG